MECVCFFFLILLDFLYETEHVNRFKMFASLCKSFGQSKKAAEITFKLLQARKTTPKSSHSHYTNSFCRYFVSMYIFNSFSSIKIKPEHPKLVKV